MFDIGNVEGGLVFAEIRKSSEEDGSRILLYMSLMNDEVVYGLQPTCGKDLKNVTNYQNRS